MKKWFLLSLIVLVGLTTAVAQDGDDAGDKVPAGKVQPRLIRGPYLQVATTHSIVVRWRTDALIRGRVHYGSRVDQLDKVADDSTLTTEHIVKIDGLQPETKYFYSIGSFKASLQGDSGNYFVTLPPAGKKGFYRIGVFGDCGNNSTNQRNVHQAMLNYLGNNYLNAWILLGDNCYSDGTDAEFQAKFFNIYKDDLLKKYPLFPAPGNHDYHDIESSAEVAQRTHTIAYYQNFSMPEEGEAGGAASHTKAFYSYDIGNVHFLSLDSYGKEENMYRMYDTAGPQVQWVKRDLEANVNKQWIVAYWHHPPYTMGSHSSDNSGELKLIRENFIRILERYGVDLILCGHSHDYERSKLMAGYYGMEADFSPKYYLSSSSGKYDGSLNSCPYIKDSTDRGTVYVVSGSAGQLGGKQPSWPHDALPFADATNGGSCILEVDANRLDLKWICADGVIRDRFTMMKEVNKRIVLHARKGEAVTLTASYAGEYKWKGQTSAARSIEVRPGVGVTVYSVGDPQGCLRDVFEVHVEK